MLRPGDASLFCPRNDLESATILEIAQEFGMDCRTVAGGWGLTLDEALIQHPDIDSLRSLVLVVELPGDEARERLRRAGKVVYDIDHHDRAEAPSAPRPSSLEQFAQLVGRRLTEQEYLIAIADRDFLPGLSAVGVEWAQAQALRVREREVRGEAAAFDAAVAYAATHRRRFGALNLVLAPLRFRDVMLDVLQQPEQNRYERAAGRHEAVVLDSALALFYDDEDPDRRRVVELRFAGPASSRPAIAAVRADPRFAVELLLWSGGGHFGGYLGAAARPGHPAPPFDALVSRLLGYVLGTGTPVRDYRCTFLLPLDLFDDADLGRDPATHATRFDKHLDQRAAAGDIDRHRTHIVPQKDWKDSADEEMLETEARLYFLPNLQDLMFDTQGQQPRVQVGPHREVGLRPIERWRLPGEFVASLRWHLTGEGIRGAPPIVARICDCSLYRYYNGLFVFALSVALDDRPVPGPADAGRDQGRAGVAVPEQLSADGAAWWHPLFYSTGPELAAIEHRQLDHWLRFTKHARILYRSFVEQLVEGKFENQRLEGKDRDLPIGWTPQEESLSPIIAWLLRRFFMPRGADAAYEKALAERLRLQYLCEERMFVNVAYALCGERPVDALAQEQRERLFSLALYVDRESDTWASEGGYAYDREYTRALMKGEDDGKDPRHRLDRWRGLGILSGYGPYSNAYLGDGGFFSNIVAPRHVPYHYERMLILVLFYQLTLRGYNRRITHATARLIASGSDPGSAFRTLRRGFIEFTNNYWFREVTLAIQGQEIFARQVAAAELDAEYQEIKDEMERADEYTASVRDRDLNEWVAAATVFGFFVALVALPWPWPGAALLILAGLWAFCRLDDHRALPCFVTRLMRRLTDGRTR